MAGRRNEVIRRKGRRNAFRPTEPAQAGSSEHERIVLARVELPQARVEITADGQKGRAREQSGELRAAAHAAGADAGRAPEGADDVVQRQEVPRGLRRRSEEHTSELQSPCKLG